MQGLAERLYRCDFSFTLHLPQQNRYIYVHNEMKTKLESMSYR